MNRDLIDDEGFRANVGIVIANARGELFWARRVGKSGWQFPQGGILRDESPREAMFRELHEEVGLTSDDVEVVTFTNDWHRYRLPKRYQRKNAEPRCIGQKQIWFMLRLQCSEDQIRFDTSEPAEFEEWKWVDDSLPAKEVIFFKRKIYALVLDEFKPHLRG